MPAENGYLRKSDFWKIIAMILINSLVVVFAAGILYAKVLNIEDELTKIQLHYDKADQRYRDLHTRVIILETQK